MKLLSRNLPVIVTGDFNAVPTDDPIKVLTDEKDPRHLTHARTLAPLCYGPEWTFHDYGRVPLDERVWIDYIFVKGNVKVLRHGVLAEVWITYILQTIVLLYREYLFSKCLWVP